MKMGIKRGGDSMQIKISPLLQSQLVEQVSAIRQSMDGEYWEFAWRATKTLIRMLNEKDGDALMKDAEVIEKQISNVVVQNRRSDRILNMKMHKNVKRQVLVQELPKLFRKIMVTLYEGGYMEDQGVQPRYRGKRLEAEK